MATPATASTWERATRLRCFSSFLPPRCPPLLLLRRASSFFTPRNSGKTPTSATQPSGTASADSEAEAHMSTNVPKPRYCPTTIERRRIFLSAKKAASTNRSSTFAEANKTIPIPTSDRKKFICLPFPASLNSHGGNEVGSPQNRIHCEYSFVFSQANQTSGAFAYLSCMVLSHRVGSLQR